MASSQFEVITITALPEITRGGGSKESQYPFDALKPFPEAGNSFFVPPTETRPNPAKSLASTVASATKRYAKKGLPNTYTLRKFERNGVVGALVVRTK